MLQWILQLLSTTETGATAETTYTLPSGATIETEAIHVTSWAVNLTPSDITQVGLLNATIKDQIVNPYTVDASCLLVLALILQMSLLVYILSTLCSPPC